MGHKKFSERMGLSPENKSIILDDVPVYLRNRLWNTLRTIGPIQGGGIDDLNILESLPPIDLVVSEIFKQSIDRIARDKMGQIVWLEKVLNNKSTPWTNFFDAIELLAGFAPSPKLYNELNRVLEEEMSGYRFINGLIEPISDQVEIDSIEDALSTSGDFDLIGAREHLSTALSQLAKRPTPDYRNAIKEAISMIESLIKHIGGKGDFSKVLKSINKELGMHQ